MNENRLSKILSDFKKSLRAGNIKTTDQRLEGNVEKTLIKLYESIKSLKAPIYIKSGGYINDGKISSLSTWSSRKISDLFNSIKNENIPYFCDDVIAMKSVNFKVGDYIETYGYHFINDGGGAKYKIISNTNLIANEKDTIQLSNGNIAKLITNDVVDVKQLGAKGNGIDDDYEILNYAINNYKKIYIPLGNYIISRSLILITNNYIINCDGCLNMINELDCFVIKSNKNIININSIISKGNGLSIYAESQLIDSNEIVVNQINSQDNGLYLCSKNKGIQYNNFKGNIIVGKSNAIHLHTLSSSNGWVNENRFNEFQVQSSLGNGVYIDDEKTGQSSSVSGNRFTKIGFENVVNAINIKHGSYNHFTFCRTQESISNKRLILSDYSFCNQIGIDFCCLDKIDISKLTGVVRNTLTGLIHNNVSEIRLISNEVFLSDKGIYYRPSNINRLKNLWNGTYVNNNVTLDATTDYETYTQIMIKTNTEVTLGFSYCNVEMIGFPILISTPDVGGVIKDVNGKIILDSSETEYQNYKKIIVTLKAIDANGICYWTKEIIS